MSLEHDPGRESRSSPRKRRKAPKQLKSPLNAHSISAFCQRNSISRAFYFKLRKMGEGPRETRIFDKVLISAEAEAEWHHTHQVRKNSEY